MAYKSLIDYYGGGMVKPSDGYQLGGLIAGAGRQREYSGEIRGLTELGEQAAKRKEKVGGNWLRKLAVGTAGTFFGGPMGGAAALAADQYAREKKFKKTDFGGGKYLQDTRGKLGKQEKAFKGKGLARVGIAGVEGYLGGKSGGTFGKSASFLKGLPTDISMISGAMKGAGGASFLEAAKGVGWDIPSMLGGKSSIAGSLLPSIAPKATNAPSLYEQSDAALAGAESGAMQAAGMAVNPAVEQAERMAMGTAGMSTEQDYAQKHSDFVAQREEKYFTEKPDQPFSYENIPSQYKLSESEWAVPPTGVEGMFAEEQAARIAGRPEPEMQGEQDIYQLPEIDVFGSSPEPDTAWSPSPTDWYDEPEDEYSSYGLQSQQQPAWAGFAPGGQSGGLVEYMMPQSYQEGGYATATDPEEALRQMGMENVADDPRLGNYLEDLPQFTMGYKQKLGDVTAGGRAGLMDISQQARTQQAKTGFAGGGAGAIGQAQARKGLERGVATGRRGVVEGYQADLLSALADIEEKGQFEFGVGGGRGAHGFDVAPTGEAGWSPPAGTEGATYNYGGTNWYYSDNNWVSEDEYHDRSQEDYGP